jgi:hypothetical protein
MRRIIGDGPKSDNQKSVADERGIGCMQEYIVFSFPDEKSYVCEREKKLADAILQKNKNLWPAVVFFASGLSPELIYAQCTFPLRPSDDYNYKEASGLNNFLRRDAVVPFMREYNVSSLIVCSGSLADGLYGLDEPRIEESLFVVKDNTFRAERYHGLQKFSARGSVTAEQAKVVERLVVESQSASKRADELRKLQKPVARPVYTNNATGMVEVARPEEKKSRDPADPQFRCPLCGWSPRKDDRWSCSCGHIWNTFDTGGVCPACAYQWTVTTCLSCEQRSPHSDWYEKVGERPLAGSQSAAESVDELRKLQKPVAASVHSNDTAGKVEAGQPDGIRGFLKRLFG